MKRISKNKKTSENKKISTDKEIDEIDFELLSEKFKYMIDNVSPDCIVDLGSTPVQNLFNECKIGARNQRKAMEILKQLLAHFGEHSKNVFENGTPIPYWVEVLYILKY